MTLTSWKFAGFGLLAAGTLAAGTAGALRAQAPAAANPSSPAAQAVPANPKLSLDPPPTVEIRLAPTAIITPQGLLISQRRAALEEQLRDARAWYERLKAVDELEQNLSVDRYVDAIVKLQTAEEALASSYDQRRATVQSLISRLVELSAKKNRELQKRIARQEDIATVNDALITAQEQLADIGPPLTVEPDVEQKRIDRVRAAQARARDAVEPDPQGQATFGAIPSADPSLRTLLEQRLQTAQRRFDGQSSLYRNARTELDRVIDASQQVLQAKLGLVETPEQRRAAIQSHLDQVGEILVVARQMKESARGTDAGVAEAEDAVNQARILLARHDRGGPLQAPLAAPVDTSARPTPPTAASNTIADLKQSRVEIARELLAAAERRYPAELPAEDYLAANRDLLAAKLDAATTPAGRAAAFRSLIEVAQKLVATTQGRAQLGEKKPSDVMKMKMALLELQARAAEDAAGVNPATGDLDRRLTELERKVDQVLDILGPAKR